MTLERFVDLAAAIRDRPARLGGVRLVAVDGPGGAGKSTFAGRLAVALGGSPVAHTDDFASWENPLDWWADLEAALLEPLTHGRVARYRGYAWTPRVAVDWREIPPTEVVILEGISSARRAGAGRLSFAVWLETPAPTRLARGLARDGEAMLGAWQSWAAQEDAHFAIDGARDRADLVVDGSPTAPHDPEMTYVRLGR